MKYPIQLILISIIILSLPVLGNGQDTLTTTEEMVARDMSEIQALLEQFPTATTSWKEQGIEREEMISEKAAAYFEIWGTIMTKVNEVKERWENNNQINLQGINVSLSKDPAVTFDFDIKEQDN